MKILKFYVICFISIIFLWAFCYERLAVASEMQKKIDERTAHELVLQANRAEKTGDDFDYEGDESKMSPPFYSYAEINPAPWADGINGYFAVNPWTGDVWDLWGCKKVSTSSSRKTQAKIKKQLTPNEVKQYKRLSNVRPDCI